ncbi:MAG: hypothetical protein GY862_17175, partial [Gammaproteobacteria bacterium]|nr:hypothetical protein [Gammaproteobacteria bacterium]
MTEFNRENIKKRLQELPPRLAAAFAVRAALRVLPMLAQGRGKKDFLWFWPEKKRERHLLSVFRAPQAACLGLLEKNRDIAAYYADTYDAAAATAAYAAYNAAATADDAAAADAAAAAAAAADAAADAAYDADAAAAYAAAAANYTLKKLSLDELNFLKEDNDIFIYLQTPLWPALPEEFRDLYETFIQQLKNMGAGFDYWAEWHQERIEGKPLDLALLHESVLLPAEIKEQKKPAAINAYLKQLRNAR